MDVPPATAVYSQRAVDALFIIFLTLTPFRLQFGVHFLWAVLIFGSGCALHLTVAYDLTWGPCSASFTATSALLFAYVSYLRSTEKTDHPRPAARKRTRAASMRGPQCSGAGTQPARAREKLARFTSHLRGPHRGLRHRQGTHPGLAPDRQMCGGRGSLDHLSLSVEDWATLQTLNVQARVPPPPQPLW